MQLVWAHGAVTAELVREQLDRRLKSTVRTVLRRLEEKGFVSHSVQGRTYIFRARDDRQRVAAKAVRRIADWFCNGSIEDVMVGIVDAKMLDKSNWTCSRRKLKRRSEGGSDAPSHSGSRDPLDGSCRRDLARLKVLRVRNPHILMATWQSVLVVSLLMPFLLGWAKVPLPSATLPISTVAARRSGHILFLRLRARSRRVSGLPRSSIGARSARRFTGSLPHSCCCDC